MQTNGAKETGSHANANSKEPGGQLPGAGGGAEEGGGGGWCLP